MLVCEPNAQVEVWFRKAPAVLSEMLERPNPDHFWIVKTGLPVCEFGIDVPFALIKVFCTLKNKVWHQHGKHLQVGHTDILSFRGSHCTGGLLINEDKIAVPLNPGFKMWILGRRLSLLLMGRIQ